MVSHPFSFRTRKLSPLGPMVLGPQGPGRVGRCRIKSYSADINLSAEQIYVRDSKMRKALKGTLFLLTETKNKSLLILNFSRGKFFLFTKQKKK